MNKEDRFYQIAALTLGALSLVFMIAGIVLVVLQAINVCGA